MEPQIPAPGEAENGENAFHVGKSTFLLDFTVGFDRAFEELSRFTAFKGVFQRDSVTLSLGRAACF